MAEAQKHAVDVFLLLTRQDEILLALRQGTGYADGQWNLPSGKVEQGESVTAAVIREANEEVGMQLAESDVRCIGTAQCRNSERDMRVGFFFQAELNDGTGPAPYNAEPGKCAKIAWYPTGMLPGNIMGYSALGVSMYRHGEHFGVLGW
jgi:ADP-ribose pyrophosphatase YjhB (NUDIX family)